MTGVPTCARSEEHTSELQSHDNLVCRLLLEKKKYTAAAPCRPRSPAPQRALSAPRLRAPGRVSGVVQVPGAVRAYGEGIVGLFFFLKIRPPPECPPFPHPTVLRP